MFRSDSSWNKRKLNLLDAHVTDASAEILAGMKRLQVLGLYRTRLSNAGLARLQELKELADLDLRYSRVTSNGVESLRAALPLSRVQFSGSSGGRPKAPGTARPEGRSPEAVRSWVQALGGTAEFEGGALKAADLSTTAVSDAQLAFLASPDLERLSCTRRRSATCSWSCS